ncbi:hypothetical protein L249_2876 [Ophiocordyceps polyrhachis-furcata BCC 54312]|uniref:Uncharacterized protein n=1 Tax=Ophiocordyceps polyrhachis-furcata BCC 54312 TaxID=1330021 RepID=A0A367LSD1_9HYPO|nr:hypothetical protein L249_2876 [Ophiocordyceps polyrhachis-furcata BCC 54312]
MDTTTQNPQSPPGIPFAPQPSDLQHRQSVSSFLSPSRSHSDTERENRTTVEPDMELVEDAMRTPDSGPDNPDTGASTVDASVEETPAPIGLSLILDPFGSEEQTSAQGLSTRCVEETKSDSEPADFTNKDCDTVTSDSDPAEASADSMSSSIESNSMQQRAAKEAITAPSRVDAVETVLPSIESESESANAEIRHDCDCHASDVFATSLENLEKCVEDWAWTEDEIIPQLPQEAIRNQLLKMAQAAHSALQSVSEADLRRGHDEQDAEKDCCRSRSGMVFNLHALLSRVFKTFDVHLTTWSSSDHELEAERPTRVAIIDEDDEEMSFASEMFEKQRKLETENEKLKRQISTLEWCNHKLQQSDEASKEKLEFLSREPASPVKARNEIKEEVTASPPARKESPRTEQVEWRTPAPDDSPFRTSSQRIDWRQKFWSEQTRAIEAEESKQNCEKELDDVRWEVKGLERDLKASQTKVEQLEQRLKQRQAQEVEDHDLLQSHDMVLWDPEPQTLYGELGDLADSPRQTSLSFMSDHHEPRTAERPAASPAKIASVLAREEYTAWTDVFLLIGFLFQWLRWLLTCFISRGLLWMPVLRRTTGKDWQPMAKPERSFQVDGLVRALRQVMLFLSLHAYLSCRAERHLWLLANRQTKFYLRREQAYGRPWWIVPGVDPTILLVEVNELMAPVIAQTMDVWLPVVVNWWQGQLDRYA